MCKMESSSPKITKEDMGRYKNREYSLTTPYSNVGVSDDELDDEYPIDMFKNKVENKDFTIKDLFKELHKQKRKGKIFIERLAYCISINDDPGIQKILDKFLKRVVFKEIVDFIDIEGHRERNELAWNDKFIMAIRKTGNIESISENFKLDFSDYTTSRYKMLKETLNDDFDRIVLLLDQEFSKEDQNFYNDLSLLVSMVSEKKMILTLDTYFPNESQIDNIKKLLIGLSDCYKHYDVDIQDLFFKTIDRHYPLISSFYNNVPIEDEMRAFLLDIIYDYFISGFDVDKFDRLKNITDISLEVFIKCVDNISYLLYYRNILSNEAVKGVGLKLMRYARGVYPTQNFNFVIFSKDVVVSGPLGTISTNDLYRKMFFGRISPFIFIKEGHERDETILTYLDKGKIPDTEEWIEFVKTLVRFFKDNDYFKCLIELGTKVFGTGGFLKDLFVNYRQYIDEVDDTFKDYDDFGDALIAYDSVETLDALNDNDITSEEITEGINKYLNHLIETKQNKFNRGNISIFEILATHDKIEPHNLRRIILTLIQ